MTVALGESKTCTLTNNDIAPKLHLRKVVVNDNGGTATVASFTLTADGSGANDLSGTSPVDSGAGLQADTWALSETSPAGYSASDWECVGGTQNGSNITVGIGEEATCTITNDDITPKLIVIKHVINDNGGTKGASDFTMEVSGNNVNPVNFAGAEAPGTNVTLNAGAYSVAETGPAGYSPSFSADCTGSIAVGETKTCTITNNDIQPRLRLIKTVVNDNGGAKQISDFPLFVDTTPVISGAFNGFNAGSYTASETEQYGYAASDWGGDCAADGSVTLGIGESKTCTITNNDIQPTLTLIKTVVNNNGGTKTVADFPLFVSGTSVTSGAANGFNAGSYVASETSQYGYTASAWGGDCAANGSVTLSVGDNKTCTITNDDQPGTIVIIKNAKPAQGSFAFTTTGSGYNGFTLTGDTANNGNKNTQSLNAGTYTVKEDTQLGWILTGIGGSSDPSTPYSCVVTGSGGSTGVGDLNTQTATIDLKNGDTVTCTFENTGQGATRTQGFWATHPQLAEIAWFGGSAFGHTFPGVSATTGIGNNLICGRPIDTLGKLTGGFWSDIAKISTGAKRSSLDQARMQLLQQLLAAELNASAFGSLPAGGTAKFAAWESALCGTNTKAIQTAMKEAASFNNSGDSATFTPGTSADSKYARSVADIPFWDIIKQ